MVTYETAHQLIFYCEESGRLRWKPRPLEMFLSSRGAKTWNTRYAGKDVGTVVGHKSGKYTKYKNVIIRPNRYKAHRLIWLMKTGAWPNGHIDHIDGNGLNNSWGNLREATSSQNACNQKVRSDSTSGVKGVSYDKKRGLWYVYIDVDKKRKHLGRYGTKDEAISARSVAEKIYHGEYARSA